MRNLYMVLLLVVMVVVFSACGEKTNSSENVEKEAVVEVKEDAVEEALEEESVAKAEVMEEAVELVDGMRPEFKEAMDSYEAFYKEYCKVLKKYKENPADLAILTEYSGLMEKSIEMGEKFEEWDEDELNTEELKYYVEVSGRITQMLVEVGEE